MKNSNIQIQMTNEQKQQILSIVEDYSNNGVPCNVTFENDYELVVRHDFSNLGHGIKYIRFQSSENGEIQGFEIEAPVEEVK